MPVRIEKMNGAVVESPLVVGAQVPIKALTDEQLKKDSLLVASADGQVVGMLWTSDIQHRLRATHPVERSRWLEMPVGNLLNETWEKYDSTASTKVDHDDFVLIFEDGEAVCIGVGDEIFLNANRLVHVMRNAATDPLTGLTSRSVFERRFSDEWDRSARMKVSIGVIFVDMDRFKLVNDQYGHLVGDAVIKEVASRIKKSLRSYDVLSRFGGDEFVAFCTGLTRGKLHIPCERILDAILSKPFVKDDLSIPLSASIGGAILHTDVDWNVPRDLLEVADQCLYLAKRQNGCAIYWEQSVQEKLDTTAGKISLGNDTTAANRVLRASLEEVC